MLNTLFSQQSLKAWVAGIITLAAPYLVEWLNSITADSVAAFFGQYGYQVSDAGAALVVGIAGLLVVYFTKNKPAA